MSGPDQSTHLVAARAWEVAPLLPIMCYNITVNPHVYRMFKDVCSCITNKSTYDAPYCSPKSLAILWQSKFSQTRHPISTER